eukprot:gene9110-18877_t
MTKYWIVQLHFILFQVLNSHDYATNGSILPNAIFSSELSTMVFKDRIDQNEIEIINIVDQGRFSTVFRGVTSGNNSSVIIKVVKQTLDSIIKREIDILKMVQDIPGIIKLIGYCRDNSSRTTSLIFEDIGHEICWLSHQGTSQFTDTEIRIYLMKLLQSIEKCHSLKIIHRDIKPRNIIINRRTEVLKLIDFGLSEIYIPNQEFNTNVASLHFRSPELLCGYKCYNYSIDIWAIGCVLAGLLFIKDPFLSGGNNLEQLSTISIIFGSASVYDLLNKFHIKINDHFQNIIGNHQPMNLCSFIDNYNKHLCTDDAIDLLSKMLIVNPDNRLSAKDCLTHRYFDPVRHLL